MRSTSSSMRRKNSKTSRLFPIPGSPTIVTSCGTRLLRTPSSSPSNRASSARGRPAAGAAASPSARPRRASGAIGCHTATGSALPLRVDRACRPVLDDVQRCAIGRVVDEDRVRRRRRLEPGGRVEDVAPRQPSALVGRGTGVMSASPVVYADVDVQVELRIGRVECRDGVEGRQRGAHRTLGIVLVAPRGAEEHEDRVADELRHRPAQALELAADAGVVGVQQLVDVLWVHELGAPGEAHEIAEERRHHLALLLETGAVGRCQLHHRMRHRTGTRPDSHCRSGGRSLATNSRAGQQCQPFPRGPRGFSTGPPRGGTVGGPWTTASP